MTQPNAFKRLEPLLLLFAAGLSIGLIFPLGKLSADLGLPPLVFAGATAAGASVVLAFICRIAGERVIINAETLRYAAIAGQLTFAIPFVTLLIVIPNLGSGIPAILQSLAPLLTLGIVSAFGVERPGALRIAGLLIGLIGTSIILLERNSGSLGAEAHIGWSLLALVTPASLAAGNVYRTTHWPDGHGPLPLAMLTLASAAGVITALAAALYFAGLVSISLGDAADGVGLVAAQSLAIGIGYAFFFRLQQVGGPVYLSQISYLNTAVGVAFAVLLFGERLSLTVWLAVALILAGVAMVNRGTSATK
ncbi:DMT family transporter [Hyphomicrobium sp. LHD-15]|uniref:DMT family transporter n=1 Tax=Hyphomicrobium sp. LHD-15 TaxID=3072142 RepID=UPI00280D1731|nr:DMT family transporter [Hyphomicrobium sp. LHD-15]MDQ8698219.1 DMT family transporter [Hyphomicrobium sp. LHD-15]